jgi:hypothetical protein
MWGPRYRYCRVEWDCALTTKSPSMEPLKVAPLPMVLCVEWLQKRVCSCRKNIEPLETVEVDVLQSSIECFELQVFLY